MGVPKLVARGNPPKLVVSPNGGLLVSDHHATEAGSCDDCCISFVYQIRRLNRSCSPTSSVFYIRTSQALSPGDIINFGGSVCYEVVSLIDLEAFGAQGIVNFVDCSTCNSSLPVQCGHCKYVWQCRWDCETETWGEVTLLEADCVTLTTNHDWLLVDCGDENDIIAQKTTSDGQAECDLNPSSEACECADIPEPADYPPPPNFTPSQAARDACCESPMIVIKVDVSDGGPDDNAFVIAIDVSSAALDDKAITVNMAYTADVTPTHYFEDS